ncbi:hypothetical protein [Vibrio jasicida]|uniref:hypothetical protein n=1 Tax=Vibrio jasicida TaxID=766224 RepID=UPI0005EE5E93|nr:hypothetical protein [Vibrio jasicida]
MPKINQNIDPNLLAKLADPEVQKQLTQLLNETEDQEVTTYAPFYRAKTGKITVGHLGIEKHRESLELTPIYEDEAVKLGLMDKVVKQKAKSKVRMKAPENDLNNPPQEELAELRQKAKALGIANWGVKGAAKLRGEITKIELKAESAKHDENVKHDSEVVTDDSGENDT